MPRTGIRTIAKPADCQEWPDQMVRRASPELNKRVGLYGLTEIQHNFLAGGRTESGGGGAWRPRQAWQAERGMGARLLMRTPGAGMYGAIRYRVTGTGAAVESPKGYSATQNYGATIKPVKKRFLTIPMVREAIGRPARSFPGLFVIRSRAGNPLLVRKQGSRLIPYYFLARSARIPQREFMMLPNPQQDELQNRIANYVGVGKWTP